MNEEEKEAIEYFNGETTSEAMHYGAVLVNLIETQKAEIEKKDNAVRNIIHRLESDIQNITKTKADGYTDDYRRCRLKAYRTKTREIKQYIEKEYFNLVEGEKKDGRE